MGVINLGALVEKLKKKLSGTFITTTDYATTSKAGIVKVGSNLTMNGTSHKLDVPIAAADTLGVVKVGSGLSIADGVLSASSGGLTATELFKGSSNLNANQALTDKISNYTFLNCVFADEYNEHFTVFVPVAFVVLGTTKFSGGISNLYVMNFSFVSGETVDSVHKESSTGSCTLKAVYGYK